MKGLSNEQRRNNSCVCVGGYLPWLDTAKGLGLYLVVLGHLWYQSNLPIVNQGIYSFHMPLFFMISGFLINGKKNRDKKQLLKKQVRRILLPGIIFVIVFLPIYFVTSDTIDIPETIERIFFWEGRVPYNDPCWFFFVLFEAKIIEVVLNLSTKKIIIKVSSCIVSFVIGYVVYYKDIFLPFGLDRCLLGFGFLMCGQCIKDFYLKWNSLRLMYKKGFLIVTFILWILSGIYLNSKVSMYAFELGKYWMFVLSGICGSLIFVVLCYKIDSLWPYFRIWGENTVFIVCTHYFFVSVFRKFTGIAGIQYTWFYDIGAIIFAAILLCCYMPICKFVNKYLPVLNGRI